MYGNCEQCIVNGFADEELSDQENASNMITYQNWCRQDKKVQKVSLTIDYQDALEQWIEEISDLKKHIHRKRIQAEEFNKRKEELEEGELIVQCDYRENYKNVEQDEIQSVYFGHTCFSIFTACGYHKPDDKLIENPITILTKASYHSRIAAFTCFSKVVHTIHLKMQASACQERWIGSTIPVPFRMQAFDHI